MVLEKGKKRNLKSYEKKNYSNSYIQCNTLIDMAQHGWTKSKTFD